MIFSVWISSILAKIPKSVWGAIITALAINTLGLLFILSDFNQEVLVSGDGIGYLELATNLHQDLPFGRYVEEGFIYEVFRTPGLPYLYSLFMDLGLGLKHYFIFLSFLSACLIPLLSWYIAKKLFTEKVAVIVCWLLAIEPLIWLYNWTFLTEIPFLIVLLFGAVCLIKAYERNVFFSFEVLFSGVLFGLSAYIRPAVFPLVFLSLVVLFVERTYVNGKPYWIFGVVFLLMLLTLVPWYQRVHDITGEYALSGTGWRNVYTDYLASIRAVNNNTVPIDEKNNLKQYAMQTWGMKLHEINDPKNSDLFKAYAIPEILFNIDTVIKLQGILFVSYFTHTDFQRKLQKLEILPMNRTEEGRRSSSRLILEQGLWAIDDIYIEMKNRYFLPIIERLWSFSLLILAVVGFISTKHRIKYLILLVILFGYITSSAIGFGVEGRLRIPILPFYYMLSACGIIWVQIKLMKLKNLWK